jgi:hypothetical protein
MKKELIICDCCGKTIPNNTEYITVSDAHFKYKHYNSVITSEVNIIVDTQLHFINISHFVKYLANEYSNLNAAKPPNHTK